MIYLKYADFVKENLNPDIIDYPVELNILESIITDSKTLLDSIEAEEVEMFKIFELPRNTFNEYFSLEDVYKNRKFLNALKKSNLTLSKIEETEDSETFIENTLDVKFILVHTLNHSELDNPKYILIQFRKKIENIWGEVKCYKVNGDIQNLYDKLTNKTITFTKNNKEYVYYTSNSGNNWQLKNKQDKTDQFLELMDKNQMKMILQDKDVKISIEN
jgi:flagellar biosynthesis/type III secretory pathway chaperone